jgi:hypothetical protein
MRVVGVMLDVVIDRVIVFIPIAIEVKKTVIRIGKVRLVMEIQGKDR